MLALEKVGVLETSVSSYFSHWILILTIFPIILCLLLNIFLGSLKYIKVFICYKHVIFLSVVNSLSIVCLLTLHSNLFHSIFISLTASPVSIADFSLIEVVFLRLILSLGWSPLQHFRIHFSLLGNISTVIIILVFLLIVKILHILATIPIVCLQCCLVSQVLLRIIATLGILSEDLMRNMTRAYRRRFGWFTSQVFIFVLIF